MRIWGYRVVASTMCSGRATLLAFAGLALAICPRAQAQGNAPPQAPNTANVEVHLQHVQGNVWMLVGAGGNITVQVGDDGVLVVDAGLAGTTDKVWAAIRSLSDKPLRYIINTHMHADHTGGNEALAKLGSSIAGGNVVGDIGASAGNQAAIIAAQEVLDRMSAPDGDHPPAPQGAWPTETFTTVERKMFFNGEGILLTHIPHAHTDGDTIVFFRRSDVISTGDIFVTNGYPIVDLAHGGNIQGVIDGLNQIIEIAIPADEQEGGTQVIPGHGRQCDVADVVWYQEMVTIIRDRIQDMVNKGMTLDQVKAARPTLDYDPRYGRTTGRWTTDMFVEAVYKSLAPKKDSAGQ